MMQYISTDVKKLLKELMNYFKNRLLKEKDFIIWASTSNTCKILNTTADELYSLRKHNQLSEHVDFVKIDNNRKRSPLKYNLQKLCMKLYGCSLETFTDPDFNYQKWVSNKFDKQNV